MTKILSLLRAHNSLLRAHNELVQAIKSVPGDISISAAEPIVTAFGNYIEAIRAEVKSERKLQTHMEDLQAELDEAALPDSAMSPAMKKIVDLHTGRRTISAEEHDALVAVNPLMQKLRKSKDGNDDIIEGEIVN